MSNNYKLNPEIKEQFDKLDFLIKQEIEKSHEDTLAEAISKEWGDYLKTSTGFDMLQYAYDISQTRSERAKYGLEESVRFMKDDELGDLLRLGPIIEPFWPPNGISFHPFP